MGYRIKVIASDRAAIHRHQNIACLQLTAPGGAETWNKILDADTVLAPL